MSKMIRPATQYSHTNVNTEKMRESQQQPLKTLGMTSAISTAGEYRLFLIISTIISTLGSKI